ncbi:hypothetical protein BMI91_18320 [Thioclava sediminum]|uniref:Uncharacterized protein n=2 Tax=Thioclava sediminum TaxID=1915319 RepID=A0ABX3MWG3_9RHOB|nr:hypothetical protein BMI91_18320 [Thioclava sediminum]
MSAGKVKIVNRVLENLLVVLEGQPDAKYLEALDDDDLPQVSDGVLVMVQFKSALASFKERHYRHVSLMGFQWITEEFIDQLKAEYDEDEDTDEASK